MGRQAAELYRAGKYEEAIPLAEKSLTLSERLIGPGSPGVPLTIANLNTLGLIYEDMGNYAKAEPFFVRAVTMEVDVYGLYDRDTATGLNNLGTLFYAKGDFARAEETLKRALDVREDLFGEEHSDTVVSLNSLAMLYRDMGDFVKAEPMLVRALAACEKVSGPENPTTAIGLSNLALFYETMGDFAKAEPLLVRALAICEKALRPEHPYIAQSLSNLAELYRDMGDFAKAEQFYSRALAIREKAFGPKHPDVAASLNSLAELCRVTGDYKKAEPLHLRALAIRQEILGPDHRYTGNSLNNLGILYREMGDFAKAEPLLVRALAIDEKALGPNHPNTAATLNNLAVLYWTTGDYKKAEPLYQRALSGCEKTFGAGDPHTADTTVNLALLRLDMDGPGSDEARKLAGRAAATEEAALSNILAFASEDQRLAFQAANDSLSLPAMLGNATEIARAILHHKGVVLDSLLEDRRLAESSKDPAQRGAIERLRAVKAGYTRLLMLPLANASDEARRQRQEELQSRADGIERIESDLAHQVNGLGKARLAVNVPVAEVQGAMAADQVLVETLRYRHYLGKLKWEDRYGALVLPASGEPKWVLLGAARGIEQNVSRYRQAARGQSDEAELHTVLRALYEQIWNPVAAVLPKNVKTVILSPDGELNFVSFATLLAADDKFLIEQYGLRYVASGRDLLRSGNTPLATPFVALFGNPTFTAEAKLAVQRMQDLLSNKPEPDAQPPRPSGAAGGDMAMSVADRRDFRGLEFKPLPGTRQECLAWEKQAKVDNLSCHVFLGADATEAQVREIKSPRVLLLATHGFFLPETKEEPTNGAGAAMESPVGSNGSRTPRVALKNPMHRSGVALAGAQPTFDAWAKGEVPPGDNDGILTAEEVGGLDLRGTWLVALSACDTGTGEVRAGEGVLGLRRGFIQAGAQNLLMTLWPISDEATVAIMADFYAEASKSGNAPAALCEVQRRWLVKLRHGSADKPAGPESSASRHMVTADEDAKTQGGSLADAVRLTGPFIISSMGRQ